LKAEKYKMIAKDYRKEVESLRAHIDEDVSYQQLYKERE